VAPLVAGLLVLGWTILDFATAGGGTLAPWDPPRQLVTHRLYQVVRNPMYLGVLATIGGLGLIRESTAVLWYTLAMAMVFHLRVVGWEEPALGRQFGEPYQAYLANTPRWIPRWLRSSR
jgi:protein-S-isoprenylcysteine O-methyltransferase Ste14